MEKNNCASFSIQQAEAYRKAYRQSRLIRTGLFLLSFPFQLAVWLKTKKNRQATNTHETKKALLKDFHASSEGRSLKEKLIAQESRKADFFHRQPAVQAVHHRYLKLAQEEVERSMERQQETDSSFSGSGHLKETVNWIKTQNGFLFSLLLGWPMYLLLAIVSRPILHYIVNRLLLTFFVIIGVTVIVFTLLYLSPSDSATNILGQQASPQQIDAFNELHGLDDPFLVQLMRTVKGVLTFDIGNSYAGNEQVVSVILRRFPVTLNLTVMALVLSVMVALPAGIYAAVKANTTFDHLFMFIALIGMSIPSFWQGLIFILTFSIRLSWLPATYHTGNLTSLLMPAVVLGTGLMASVARMTRSSMLEVIHEDYMLTARAKGLPPQRVIFRHGVVNALIPIITVIGLQFGGMLGGAAITEKVFNISGIGSYIVDRQFIPDIPGVMGGVIYIALTVSVVNLFVDLLYHMLDPRIRSRIKNGR